jgi:hypothetical protein
MLDANAVEGYRFEEAWDSHFVVAGQRSFGMRGAAARALVACSQGASAGAAVACRALVVGVVDVAG